MTDLPLPDADLLTSAPPMSELLEVGPTHDELPDAELMQIIVRRVGIQCRDFVRAGRIPRDDWEDGCEGYRRIFMQLWLRCYYRTWFRYLDHNAAIQMCSHLGVLEEMIGEALRRTAKMLRWDRRKDWRMTG